MLRLISAMERRRGVAAANAWFAFRNSANMAERRLLRFFFIVFHGSFGSIRLTLPKD
jgi:hypothetical protein